MRDPRLALPVGSRSLLLRPAAAAAGTTTTSADVPRLIATVGSPDDPDAYEISLTTEDGDEGDDGGRARRVPARDRRPVYDAHLSRAARHTGIDLATESRAQA